MEGERRETEEEERIRHGGLAKGADVEMSELICSDGRIEEADLVFEDVVPSEEEVISERRYTRSWRRRINEDMDKRQNGSEAVKNTYTVSRNSGIPRNNGVPRIKW